MAGPTDPFDYSAPGAQESSQQPQPPALPTTTTQTVAESTQATTDTPRQTVPPPPDEYLQQELRNDLERRVMRYSLFGVIIVFGVIFLIAGLIFALKVGNGLLKAKSEIVTALTKVDTSSCLVPLKCTPAPPKGLTDAVVNLNADWLSASSMIMIVAFILGVGLTLILTLLKSAFRHPTDSSSKDEANTTSLELATPLSELISSIVSYLKEKFSK